MRKAVTIFALFAGSLWAAAQTFTADTTYAIHRNGNTSAYMYQNGTSIGTGSLSAQNMCWWKLIPTQTDCYYIQNASTGEYVQSSYTTELSQNVPMGSTPVEFQIKTDDTAGATTNGFYYMASTDQTVTTVGDVSKGLNFGATGVVSYWIKTGRGNSYWQIEPSKNLYVVPTPDPEENDDTDDPAVVAERVAQSLGIYSVPCGTVGNYYLRSLQLEGLDTLVYSSTSKPESSHVVYTSHQLQAQRGGCVVITPRIAWYSSTSVSGYVYTDWDGDGQFNDTLSLKQNTADTLTIPANAPLGQRRLRVRVTTTGTKGAEDDVIGACYDFMVNVVDVAENTITVEVNDSTRGSVSYYDYVEEQEEGRPAVSCVNLTATPNKNSKFVGWKRMVNDFQGSTFSTDSVTSLEFRGNVRVQAVFGLKTEAELKAEETSVASVHTTLQNKGLYDLKGRKASTYTRGIVISNGKKHINK